MANIEKADLLDLDEEDRQWLNSPGVGKELI